MQGGITVVGLVTGDHIIEDIKLIVPHKTAVYVSAEDYLRSKDLHRALGQGRIFRIDGATLYGTHTPEPAPPPRVDPENQRLRQELAAAASREAGMTQVLMQLQQQMSELQAGMGRLEARPTVVGVAAPVARAQAEELINSDAPTFIPTTIKPEDATTQIRVERQVAEGSSLSDARNKLKELNRKKEQG